MKKSLMNSIIVILMLSFTLAGCGKDKKQDASIKDEAGNLTETGRTEEADEGADSAGAQFIDITSGKDVNDFIKGEWRLMDTVGGGEFATLVIYDDGRCEYDRDTDDFLVEGAFSVKQHQTYDADKDELIDDGIYTGFELSLYDIPNDFNPPKSDRIVPDDETTDGIFHIARGEGYDYLYLEWIGNGDSYIFDSMFQNAGRLKSEYDRDEKYELQTDMVFRRANEFSGNISDHADDKFYGLVWEKDTDGGLWIQAMDVHSKESEDEYTGRRFTEAYFTECKDSVLKKYELTKYTDRSLVFNTSRLDREYPVMMCGIETDKNGKIKRLREVDKAYYGKYDLGTLEQKYAYKGLKFTVNGTDFDLKDYESEAEKIVNMEQAGDWIVIRTAVPPHYSEYYLYNIYTGSIEDTKYGENLTWVDDDITTAVYSSGNAVYNFKDHIIGTTDGAEVKNLKLNSDGRKILALDENGETYAYELEDDDKAMYKFSDFSVKYTARSWREFIDCAPDDAIAYVMVNPPKIVKNRLPWAQSEIDNSTDCVYVVALKDGTTIHADYGRYDYEKDSFETENTFDQTELLKGSSKGYEMSVTEGIPYFCIFVSTKDEGGMFPVATISGKSDQCGMFITASMSGEEALEKSTFGKEKYFDLADSYMDILYKYKEAQDNRYSQEKIEQMGLSTELVQLAWPTDGNEEAVKYVLYDIDKNGTSELIITYNDSIVDIWASDGKKVKYAYGCPYRGNATLHEDGILKQLYAPSMNYASTTWFKFNTAVGDFFPDIQMQYEPSENDPKGEHYYVFSYESGREEMERIYGISGDYPVWISEWEDEITKEKYDELCTKAPEVKLPEGEKIADFKGL